MSRTEHLEPVFVEFIPRELDTGKLYISMVYTTTAHLCASGCGHKVVLPLSPAQWQLYFDGQAVSLSPSVGNWELPCQAHYWIRKNRIQWAPHWDRKRIEAGRRSDTRDIDDLFGHPASAPTANSADEPRRRSIWERIFGWRHR